MSDSLTMKKASDIIRAWGADSNTKGMKVHIAEALEAEQRETRQQAVNAAERAFSDFIARVDKLRESDDIEDHEHHAINVAKTLRAEVLDAIAKCRP